MIIIDFSPIANAAFCVIDPKEYSEDLLRHNILNSILNHLITHKKYGEVVVALDSRNYWRKDLHPEYKGHRKAAKEKSPLDWKAFYDGLNNIIAEFKLVFPWKFIEVDRMEADDIVGTLALTAKEPTIIISNDGDFKQCCRNPRVKFWSTHHKKFLPDQTLYEVEYDLHAKIMGGDTGDNIMNVLGPMVKPEGTRQKACTQRLIEQAYTEGVGETLIDRYNENKALIDLREIPQEYKDQILAAYEVPPVGNKQRVWKYLTLSKLNRVGSFIDVADNFC